ADFWESRRFTLVGTWRTGQGRTVRILNGGSSLVSRGGLHMADDPLPTTRITMLTRLRQEPWDQASWDEFVERYGGHIYQWCRRWKLQDADALDVTQNILMKLTLKLRAFAYDPARSFRGWLRTVAHHAWRDFEDSRRHGSSAASDSEVRELLLTL